MWLLIIVAVAILFGAISAVVGGGIFTIVAVPIGLILAAFLVGNFIRRGEEAPQVVEKREPTGRPRAATGGAETANERVGQS
jgi:hypothetical protein